MTPAQRKVHSLVWRVVAPLGLGLLALTLVLVLRGGPGLVERAREEASQASRGTP